MPQYRFFWGGGGISASGRLRLLLSCGQGARLGCGCCSSPQAAPVQSGSLASRKGLTFCRDFGYSSWDLGALPAWGGDPGKAYAGSSELLAASARPRGCRPHGADLPWSHRSFLSCWHTAHTFGPAVAFGTLAPLCPSVMPPPRVCASSLRPGRAWEGRAPCWGHCRG